jgi:carbonic anhydrase
LISTYIDRARGYPRRAPAGGDGLRRLAEGQHPDALFISCSDSRMVPALITGAEPGQLFELRTAGGIVPRWGAAGPSGEAATVEYAVSVLGVRDVVVCGHSHCGAVGALVRGEALSGAPAVRDWLEHSAPAVARPLPEEAEDPAVAAAVQRHLLDQLDRLREHPCVQAGLTERRLGLHAWYYQVDTGAVTVLDHRTGRFEQL